MIAQSAVISMTPYFTVEQHADTHHVIGRGGELVHIFEPRVPVYSTNGTIDGYHLRDSRQDAYRYAAWKNQEASTQ